MRSGIFQINLVCCLLLFSAYNSIAQNETEPFLKAEKFDSDGFFQVDARFGTFAGSGAGFTAMSINWVVNHRYILGAQYNRLTAWNASDIAVVNPDTESAYTIRKHQGALLRFGYVIPEGSKLGFTPFLAGGWGHFVAKGVDSGEKLKSNFLMMEVSGQGFYAPVSFMRIGVGLGYTIGFSEDWNMLELNPVNSFWGSVFLQLGTF